MAEAEKTFGQRVKKLRRDKGLTQIQLADELYISESYIALIEADKRNPSMDIMIKLADYFHVTSDYLIRGISADVGEQSCKEWSEMIKGRSDKEISYAIGLVKAFFDCLDDK